MKKIAFKFVILSAFALFMNSCSDSDDPTPDPTPTDEGKVYHITAKFDGKDNQVYMAGVKNLDEGSLTFIGNGYALNPIRSARVFTDDLGWVYVYDYGGGYLQKFSYTDGKYTKVRELDMAPVMGGNAYVRPWKINEETILIHNINTSDVEDNGNGITKEGTMYVTRVLIPDVVISEIMKTWTVPMTTWDISEKSYPFRIDAPTVLGDKIYYGVGRRQLDNTIPLTGMHTIVLDYPSLKNPEYIRTEKGNGNTNGYRGGNMHAIDGYVYQANSGDPTMIVRLKDGAYDESWSFNATAALGETFSTNNWYHAGNGICYVSAQFTDEGDENNKWGVVRIDISNKTAIKMNVPMSTLFGYQHGIVKDGKFYMAICPITGTTITDDIGRDGKPIVITSSDNPRVYIFDVASEDPNAFTTGLTLDKGNIFIEGIF
jgi:hypothetical protein